MSKCATALGVAVLSAWTAAAGEFPRIESFLGYAHLRLNRGDTAAAVSANGGAGQFIINFTGWLGGVADVGAVHNTGFAGFGIDNTTINFLFGPRVSLRTRRLKPYAQVLFGGAYYAAGKAAIRPPEDVTGLIGASQTAFAAAVGGGIDIKATRHFAVRPFEVDYVKTQFRDLRVPADDRQNGFRYLAGVNVIFGGEKAAPAPPPPETKICPNGAAVLVSASCPKQNLAVELAGSAKELCPGETAQLTASVAGMSNSAVHYEWSVNGQKMAEGPWFVFGRGLEPGTYSISVTASGGPAFNTATSGASIIVKQYQPPAGIVRANPAQITVGEKSTLMANFQGQCGGPIGEPIFTASEGAVRGDQFDSGSVHFDNAGQHKALTITASATDSKNNTGFATTTIDVTRKAAAVRLPDVLFRRDDARINDCGKRILVEQLPFYLQRNPGGTVLLSGHSSSDEESGVAEQRALNTAAAITAGTGVCISTPASQVMLSWPGTDQNGFDFESGFCSSSVGGVSFGSEMRRVVVWFVPSGGEMPALTANPQTASALDVRKLGCPK